MGFFLCVCVCALSAMVKNRMMPSCRELAANIWLTNDDVDTRAHKPINQTPPPPTHKLIEFTVDG